uniref:Bm14375 n=1 Tax=Brugia malayi TaxID=6279 RepID=A0A1I9G032_BRUMA|nr:Bm14375 [Brugia malayi]
MYCVCVCVCVCMCIYAYMWYVFIDHINHQNEHCIAHLDNMLERRVMSVLRRNYWWLERERERERERGK